MLLLVAPFLGHPYGSTCSSPRKEKASPERSNTLIRS
ncbi:hypothetical protein DSM3645_02843 [Blastopirellula marina DSM 3645]|uniref:Uncharacterized protein n=1 Tax=Blastopirellula marina DSM 3645 TaxID=314230 RepID=A3ZVN2_9BACT|nr:hypothetical protein DSM3645_02843 [Blastopirellula marina DSM 3645]